MPFDLCGAAILRMSLCVQSVHPVGPTVDAASQYNSRLSSGRGAGRAWRRGVSPE